MLKRHLPAVERGLKALGRRFAPDPLLSRILAYQVASGGKRLRAVLGLIAAGGYRLPPGRALPLALAAELLHNVFLIQDDLQDGDRVRRNRPAVWVEFGAAQAINAADFVLAAAQDQLLAARLPPARRLAVLAAFNRALTLTVRGQALDLKHRADPDFTVRQYLKIAALKTGYCLSLPLVSAALAAGRPGREVKALETFGRRAGPAFQIRDDVIDLTSGKGRGGETGSDIREGKPSVLFALALERLPARRRRPLAAIMAKDRELTTARDVAAAVKIYRELSVIEAAQARADALVRQAIGSLAPLPEPVREPLTALARFLAERST